MDDVLKPKKVLKTFGKDKKFPGYKPMDEFRLYPDGALAIGGEGEDRVYLYPNQVKELRRFLRVR